MKTFADLGISKDILRAVSDKGYDTPSPVQEQAIPAVLTKQDVIATAQTGTGKTAGFTLPMMHLLTQEKRESGYPIRALVLTPTRELAAQIEESIVTYGKYLPLKSLVVFGGVNIVPQIKELRKGVDILVATPGRLLDLCNQGHCRLDKVKFFVLDEADRMLDMGFIPDIRRTINLLPKKRQTILFSATFSKDIRGLAHEFLRNPITVAITPEKPAAQTIAQRAYRCDQQRKTQLLSHLIKTGFWEQVLIFTRTKHGANRLTQKLNKDGIHSSAIHGDKTQALRIRALEGFKKKNIRVLVATDIAARGIDIVQLPHVINFELPNLAEDYVHRIGRTGRAGLEGEAISLVCNDERPYFKAIEKLIGQKIELTDVTGYGPDNWPERGPSASEVQKAAALRKEANRKARGPRTNTGPRSSQNSSRKSGGSKQGRKKPNVGQSGGSKPSSFKPGGSSAAPATARPSNRRNRRRG